MFVKYIFFLTSAHFTRRTSYNIFENLILYLAIQAYILTYICCNTHKRTSFQTRNRCKFLQKVQWKKKDERNAFNLQTFSQAMHYYWKENYFCSIHRFLCKNISLLLFYLQMFAYSAICLKSKPKPKTKSNPTTFYTNAKFKLNNWLA